MPSAFSILEKPESNVGDIYFANALIQWNGGDEKGALFWLDKAASNPETHPLATLMLALASLKFGYAQEGVKLLYALEQTNIPNAEFKGLPPGSLFIKEAVNYWLGVFKLYGLKGFERNENLYAEAMEHLIQVRCGREQDLRAYLHQLIAQIHMDDGVEMVELRLTFDPMFTFIGPRNTQISCTLWGSKNVVLVLALMYYHLMCEKRPYDKARAGQVFAHLMQRYWQGDYHGDMLEFVPDIEYILKYACRGMMSWSPFEG